MEFFDYDFPMNAVMVGSVIPGVRMDLQIAKIVTYPDGTNHPLLKTRAHRPDVIKTPGEQPHKDSFGKNPSFYPRMHGPHTKEQGFMEQLKSVLAGGKQQPQLREGYELARENRDWRKA